MTKRMIRIHYDVFVGVTMLLITAYVLLTSSRMPTIAMRFPSFLGAAFGVLATFILVEGVVKTVRQAEPERCIDWKTSKYAVAVVGLSVLYGIAMRYITFFVATAIFVPGTMTFMGVRSWKTLLFVTLGTVAVAWVVFAWQLGIRLP